MTTILSNYMKRIEEFEKRLSIADQEIKNLKKINERLNKKIDKLSKQV